VEVSGVVGLRPTKLRTPHHKNPNRKGAGGGEEPPEQQRRSPRIKFSFGVLGEGTQGEEFEVERCMEKPLRREKERRKEKFTMWL